MGVLDLASIRDSRGRLDQPTSKSVWCRFSGSVPGVGGGSLANYPRDPLEPRSKMCSGALKPAAVSKVLAILSKVSSVFGGAINCIPIGTAIGVPATFIRASVTGRDRAGKPARFTGTVMASFAYISVAVGGGDAIGKGGVGVVGVSSTCTPPHCLKAVAKSRLRR